MRIIAVRRDKTAMTPTEVSEVFGLDQLIDVLGQSDFVVLTLPLTPETANLMDAARLRSMKTTAFLINLARGEIVEEAALYSALAEKQIADAAIDVCYRCPSTPDPTMPSSQPFHELSNVLMTPHMSAATEGMFDARAELIAANIERTARGERPLNEVTLTS